MYYIALFHLQHLSLTSADLNDSVSYINIMKTTVSELAFSGAAVLQ